MSKRKTVCRDDLHNLGSLITYDDGGDKETCLGYLMYFHGHGVFEPNFGKIDVTSEEADAHNRAMSESELDGLDTLCEIGQGCGFYVDRNAATVKTFVGDVATDSAKLDGRTVTFERNGRSFRGDYRRGQDDDFVFFKRVA